MTVTVEGNTGYMYFIPYLSFFFWGGGGGGTPGWESSFETSPQNKNCMQECSLTSGRIHVVATVSTM